GPTGAHARHLLARADRTHDARVNARRAGVRLRAHRARERAHALHRDRHLRFPQRHAAGRHHAWHGVFIPARRQRAGREGLCLARHRLVRGRSADRIGLRAGAGFCADHGSDVCRAQPADRHPLRPDRSAREDRSMSELVLPKAISRPQTGFAATLRHARYVVRENSVTGFAFAVFALIVLASLIGPAIVPYDPLASDTAAALKPPSVAHWFGTDQLGRDVFSLVIVATRLDFFIAVASVALVFLMGGLAGVAAGFFGGWTDRI